jgi:hypothetical protein
MISINHDAFFNMPCGDIFKFLASEQSGIQDSEDDALDAGF